MLEDFRPELDSAPLEVLLLSDGTAEDGEVVDERVGLWTPLSRSGTDEGGADTGGGEASTTFCGGDDDTTGPFCWSTAGRW